MFAFRIVICSLLFLALAASAPCDRAWGQTPGANQAQDADVPNIGTRSSGHDWPGFLGPARNGKSDETGLLASWPPDGPRIVWQSDLGTSYGAPAISRGRIFHFDRQRHSLVAI